MNLIERLIVWLLTRFGVERHDISRKGIGTYLTRFVLFGTRYGSGPKLFLHLFHRGDVENYFHDHPWPFWSWILWGGYREHSPKGSRWYGPLCLLRRPAQWQHRVELPPGRTCWTLFWPGTKERSWGFICPGRGWIPWKEHQANQDTGLPGCGEKG